MLSQNDKHVISRLEIPQLHSDKLEKQEKIGAGGFGKVMKGRYQNIPVAIKKLLKFDLNNFLREIKVLKKVKHPYVPLLIGINMNPSDNNAVCVVSELVEGTTLDKYTKLKKPSKVLLLLHMIDLASVLSYCHGINLIHRDLKPENVMIDKKMDVKLLDFGISKFSVHTNTNTELLGSITYMAPECFEVGEECNENGSQSSKIGKKVDVWAFGLILYSLFIEEKPYKFFDVDRKIQAFLIKRKDYPVDKNRIDNGKIALICEQCTKANFQDRPNMELIKSKLISALYDEIKSIYVDVNDLIGKVDSKESIKIIK